VAIVPPCAGAIGWLVDCSIVASRTAAGNAGR
jgi:hypothetical protein